MCYRLLQCVAVCCSVMQGKVGELKTLEEDKFAVCVTGCCRMLLCVAMGCCVLPCVAVCCRVL